VDNASRLENYAAKRRTYSRYEGTQFMASGKLTTAALALSDSYIVAVTTKDYVRVYTLYGTPFRVYRQKSPAVTCAAWRDYVMTIGNGPLGSDGRTGTLRYSIENVKRDEICQNEDVVAIPEGAELKSVFFTDMGVSISLLI
jgi:chromosome transmission fidelity protein 4